MIEKYSPYVHEAWATYETLRSLGFPADSLTWAPVMVITSQGPLLPTLGIVLRHRGLQFSVTCSPSLTDDEMETLAPEVDAFAKELADGTLTDSELNSVLHRSYVWTNKAALITMLLERGFVLPALTSSPNPPPTTVH